MRHLLTLLLLTLVVMAQEPITLYAGRLVFEVPRGLFAITPEAIKEGYLARYPPQHVYKNQTGDVSIAFNHMQNKTVSQESLQAFRDQLELDLKRKWPGIQWVGTSFVTLNGVRWFQLEFKSIEQGFTINNCVLGTPLNGSLLEVSLHSFADFDPVMTNALIDAKLSLRLLTQ